MPEFLIHAITPSSPSATAGSPACLNMRAGPFRIEFTLVPTPPITLEAPFAVVLIVTYADGQGRPRETEDWYPAFHYKPLSDKADQPESKELVVVRQSLKATATSDPTQLAISWDGRLAAG